MSSSGTQQQQQQQQSQSKRGKHIPSESVENHPPLPKGKRSCHIMTPTSGQLQTGFLFSSTNADSSKKDRVHFENQYPKGDTLSSIMLSNGTIDLMKEGSGQVSQLKSGRGSLSTFTGKENLFGEQNIPSSGASRQ